MWVRIFTFAKVLSAPVCDKVKFVHFSSASPSWTVGALEGKRRTRYEYTISYFNASQSRADHFNAELGGDVRNDREGTCAGICGQFK